MTTRIDVEALRAHTDIVDVINAHVPLTKNGAEYEACCPFHSEATPSFKVNRAKQFYHCFGCGAHGDVISFLQEYLGLSFVDACRQLGAQTPDQGGQGNAQPTQRALEREQKRSPWAPIMPVPDNVPEPPKAHVKRGRPEQVWRYRDANGATLGYVYRFRTSDGGKEVLPLTWCRNVDGELSWRWMAFPEPRPLYGLDDLAARPEAPVLLVEGEKCRDAAAAQLPGRVVVSWPGGGKAVSKVDFAPLFGRDVICWADCDAKRVPLTKAERESLGSAEAIAQAQAEKPLSPEADQPGTKTMTQIASILHANGAHVHLVTIPAPGDKPDGWDVADAIAEGMTGEALEKYILDNALPFTPLKSPLAAAGTGGKAVSADDSGGLPPAPPAGAGECYSGDNRNAWRRELLRRDDKLIDCRENVYLMLRHHPVWAGVLWADDFARKIVRRKPAPWDNPSSFVPGSEWGEDDDLRLGLWLAQNERLLVRSAEVLASAVGWAARESHWHPVQEYLDALEWDGIERSNDWLTDFLGVRKTPYTMLSGRLFLTAMVARIYQPGCQMRAMPIVEGFQFRGKSTALRILGGQWFGDTVLDLNNKDAYQLIQGRWVYEIAELDSFNRAETTRIKAFISSRDDRFRAPYDRAPRDWPRQCVFVGTTNQDEYFKDPTGNTRYWPWRAEEVDQINLDGLDNVRDQLFAEAVMMYRRGDRWHPTREEQQRLFEPEQSAREIADPWEARILAWLRGSVATRVTVNDILDECLKIEPGKVDSARQMAVRIGIAMKRIGWLKRRASDGDRGYYYLRPEGWSSSGSQSNDDDSYGGGNVPF